ncbi:MAG: T9SS type A sorting domain-containing protein [Gemmatimonadota bacterium]|nr:MAG: T9SS type A sorting domain-containing protein [Gemmatimonadota bacterium]
MKRSVCLVVLSLLSLCILLSNTIQAQDFMLQGFYWDYPGTPDGKVWADTLRLKAADLADAGFTYVWLPPMSRGNSGMYSMGYDPKDLYDLGEYGGGATRFGTRADVDALVTEFNPQGLNAVADMIYNHRDGGSPEDNPSVEGWIENFEWWKAEGGDNPYPSDRFRCYIPLGSPHGFGEGTYYFKIRSHSWHARFDYMDYKVYTETNAVSWQGMPDQNESEPNGGGDCGQGNNTISLGINMLAQTDDVGGCIIDEFALTLTSSDFSGDDTLWVYLNNQGGNYSDHHIYGLWYDDLDNSPSDQDIQWAVGYQTWTDFTNLPSAQGAMDQWNFKPNGNPTQLAGDWDWPWFFYDYDQTVASTQTVLRDFTRWLWNTVGVRGYRMDAVKHFAYAFTGDLLDHLHDNGIDPGMVVGEFFDGNPWTLKSWIDNVLANMDGDTKAAISPRAFDFSLRYALEAACDQFGYDARNVFTSGMVDAAGASGFNVCTFTDNHDTRDPGQPIDNDPILAYAYILTNNQVGLPTVFYYDYYNRGLKDKIDKLIEVHRNHIYGAPNRDYLSRTGTPYTQTFTTGYATTTLFYQLSGMPSGRDVLVAINFAGEALNVKHGVNVTTMDLNIGDALVDVIGNASVSFMVVDGSGNVQFEIPARSYTVWVYSPDNDGDGRPDFIDNCPSVYNPGQENSDDDSHGDVCDNCPNDNNENQSDGDGDEIGDVCDQCEGDDATGDGDGDGICDDLDQCLGDDATGDSDGDGICDDMDQCIGDDATGDSDGDGYCADVDNCPNYYNPDQADSDGDGMGDPCDGCVEADPDVARVKWLMGLVGTATYDVTIKFLGCFNNPVTLSVTGLPFGTRRYYFNPSEVVPVSPGGSTTVQLVVQVTRGTPVGDYILTITGDDGSISHSYDVTMEVRRPPRFRGPLATKENVVPEEFVLSENYPNPFNPETSIDFGLPEQSQVRVTVYNTLGGVVEVLVDETLDSGYYRVTWDAAGLPSGVYFYRIEAGSFTETKRMVLMK